MANPFQPPGAPVADHVPVPPDTAHIAALPVSDTWKTRFYAIHKAGGPRLPQLKSLPRKERGKAMGFNFLAFLFGPLYYVAKGMWRKGLTLLGLVCLLGVIAGTLLALAGLESLGRGVGIGLGVVYAFRANLDYYKKMVLGDNGWW